MKWQINCVSLMYSVMSCLQLTAAKKRYDRYSNYDFAFTGHLKWKGTLMGALLEMEV